MVTGHHALRRRRFYYPELDGLRFIAFAAVFVSHLRLETPNHWSEAPPRSLVEWWFRSAVLSGGFGVDLFFVLSSFLITSLLIREADTRGRLNVPAFWVRRILRIWPLYFAFLVSAGMAQQLPWQPFLLCGVFLGNWAHEPYGLDRFVIGPLWSVSVEEQFYVAWPLVLSLVPRRRLPWVCAGLIASSVAVRALMLALGASHTEIWMNTFARLDPIAIGALIALRWHSRPPSLSAPARFSLLTGVPLAIVADVGWVAHSVPHLPLSPFSSRGQFAFFASYVLMYLVSAVGCGAVIVAALCSRRSLLAHPCLVYLGRISYGLYVFHLAAIRIIPPVWWPWRSIAALLLTLLAGAMSYRFLEEPFLRLKDRFTYVISGPPAMHQVSSEVEAPPVSPGVT